MHKIGEKDFETIEDAHAWMHQRMKEVEGDPDMLDPDYFTSPGKKKWPFADMAVGDVVTFRYYHPKIQRYVHSYSQGRNLYFETWQEWPCLKVKRVR